MIDEPTKDSTLDSGDTHTGASDGGAPQAPMPDQRGRRINAYTLLESVGQGGMGVVYRAQQDYPHRVVAIKLLRPGVWTPDLLRRFRFEGEILGRLQHSGIAQIYEAGTTQTAEGPQPYLVMEFVEGVPLTLYAHKRALGIRDRLELFTRVCDAVQHAHQRGVIHRDLKPSNILVTDDETLSTARDAHKTGATTFTTVAGMPKILDFGVARVTDVEQTGLTLHTTAGQLVGTLGYMSPEQVSGNPNDVDTRSDVFALGLVLYELLSGRRARDLSGKPLGDAIRMIREESPQRLRSLSASVPEEVETIVHHAIERERPRRYQAAGELAADIRRFLSDEPILARPPSLAYQFQKYAKRNKAAVRWIEALLLVAAVSLAGLVYVAIEAKYSEKEALDAKGLADTLRERETQLRIRTEAAAMKSKYIAAFLTKVFESVDPAIAEGRDTSLLRDILHDASALLERELAKEPEVRGELHVVLGKTYRQIADYGAAEEHLRAAVTLLDRPGSRLSPMLWQGMEELGLTLLESGRIAEAEAPVQEALKLAMSASTSDMDDAERIRSSLARVLNGKGELREAIVAARESVEAARSRTPLDSASLAKRLAVLGEILAHSERHVDAEPVLREALELQTRLSGEDSPVAAVARGDLAITLEHLEKIDESILLNRRSLDAMRTFYGERHPMTLRALGNLGMALTRARRFEEAERLLLESREMHLATFGERHPDTLIAMNNVGFLYSYQHRWAEARDVFVRVLELKRQVHGEDHADVALGAANAAMATQQLGDEAGAEPYFRQALRIYEKVLDADNETLVGTRGYTGENLVRLGKYAEGETVLQAAIAPFRAGKKFAFSRFEHIGIPLGRALAHLQRFDESEQVLKESWVNVTSPGGTPFDRDAVASAFVELYDLWGRSADAATWRERATSQPAATPLSSTQP